MTIIPCDTFNSGVSLSFQVKHSLKRSVLIVRYVPLNILSNNDSTSYFQGSHSDEAQALNNVTYTCIIILNCISN